MEASYTEMEGKMREQIKKLQEQRAAAMMNEMIDLQKERDIALSRVKMLKKTVESELGKIIRVVSEAIHISGVYVFNLEGMCC